MAQIVLAHGNNDLLARGTFGGHVDMWF